MRVFSKFFLAFVFLSLFVSQAFADSFIVSSIRVEGLTGISPATVISYMPVKPGQRFDTSQSGQVISDIYASGFFSDVKLAQAGNVLIVKVVERPVIGSISVTGNKDIPKDKLDNVLKDMGLAQGRVFNSSVLERIKASLQNEYDAMGKTNAAVTTSVTPQPHNRVAVRIDISEGSAVKVNTIKIVGNHAFSSRTLISEMPLSTHHLWSFFNRADEFSQEKLDASADAVRDYYLDHGYLKVKVDSVQATPTADHKSVDIVISITEGPIYTIKNYQFAGNLIVPENQLRSVVTIKPGNTFSKQEIRKSTEAISRILGSLGYAFASINPVPDIDEQTKQVAITFYIDPGVRVYVRRVNFDGNVKTKDIVLRRVVRQMEGGVVNVDDIKESERQLNLTGYTESVNIETAAVPGTPDEVDLNFHVKEAPAAQATAGIGYGSNGLVLQAGVNQNNFLGTGKSLGINFNNDKISTLYNISYNDPYYTIDGISRGFNVFYQNTSPGKLNIANYTTNAFGAAVNYSIPISARGDNLSLSLGYQSTTVNTGTNTGQEILNFINQYGNRYNEIMLTAGWVKNGLDKATFATKGFYQDAGAQLAAPAGSSAVSYYKLNYDAIFYQPITDNGFIATGRAGLGYGNGLGSTQGLPFFANWFAGGIGSVGQVRGYATNSLGPKDTTAQANALGGNVLTVGSAGIIFPNPISSDKLRTSVFVDAGNVFSSSPQKFRGTSSGPLRYSAGVAVDWRVPVFNVILSVSLAKPINAQPGDDTSPFNFNIGTNF